MTTSQAHRLEQISSRLHPSDKELLWLARHCAVDERIATLANLSRVDAEDLILTLEQYEKWLLDHGQETAEEMMLDDLIGRRRRENAA